jgi:hypothetical protein
MSGPSLPVGGKSVVQREQGLEGSVRQVIELRIGRDVWVTSEVVIDSFHQNRRRVGCVRKLLDIDGLLQPSKTIKARFLNDLGRVRLKHLCSPRSAVIGSCYFHLNLINESLTINGPAAEPDRPGRA